MESQGVEPCGLLTQTYRLAICCITILPTFLVVWRKRWDSNPRSTFVPDSFQDCCHKPDSTTLPLFGRSRAIRTPTSGFGDRHATVNIRDLLFGGLYWDRTSRARGGGFTVHWITIDSSNPYMVLGINTLNLTTLFAHVSRAVPFWIPRVKTLLFLSF